MRDAPLSYLFVDMAQTAQTVSVFLEQITVAKNFRRRGYGRAMLAALEQLLAGAGVEPLCRPL